MKNFAKLFYSITLCVAITSCSDKEEQIDPEKPGDVPEIPVVDLSKEGLANCYIVKEKGIYEFKADNQFNLGEGLPVPPSISPESATLIWQTEPGSIASVDLTLQEDNSPYIKFEVSEAKGNAVIAVLNNKDEIEWSWHIWMPEIEIEGIPTETGLEVMNLNLGAINNTAGDINSYGMLYQWGRKDPFPHSPTLKGDVNTLPKTVYDINNKEVAISNSNWYDNSLNTLEFSISHPTIVLSNFAQYADSRDWLRSDLSDDSLWGNPEGEKKENNVFINRGRKTCYDPSPAGWKVAPPETFCGFTSTGGYVWTFEDFNIADINDDTFKSLGDYNYGWHFYVNPQQYLYFPAASRYDGSYGMLMGSMSGLWGNYWSNAPYGSISGGAFSALSFQIQNMYGGEEISISPSAGASRADAFSIRCVKE